MSTQFWDRLWRSAGIQFVVFLVIAYFIYGDQPKVGSSPDTLAAFYDGNRMKILIAAFIFGMAVLNLLWFAAAIRSALRDAGQDGWGAAVTASSAALGGMLFVLMAVGAALAYKIAPLCRRCRPSRTSCSIHRRLPPMPQPLPLVNDSSLSTAACVTAKARSAAAPCPTCASTFLSNDFFYEIVLNGAMKDAGMASFKALLEQKDAAAIRAYLIKRANEDKVSGARK